MRKTSVVVAAASMVLILGCKSDKAADKQPPASAVKDPAKLPAGSGAAGSGAAGAGGAAGSGATGAGQRFPLSDGEAHYGGSPMATNLVDWKLEDGSVVLLGIVTTGKDASGREQGVLRAYHAGSTTQDVGPRYSLDTSVDHWAELKVLPNNRVLFRHGEVGQGPRARNAVVLRWDAKAKKVVVAKRWSGRSDDKEPEWLVLGEFKTSTEAESLCLKVIARMVSCEKDPAFREAIFKRDDEADRAAMQTHFDTHVASWKTGNEAKAQCARWASDDYVDTTFSETAKLTRLAEDTELNCTMFGAEIVDEGGLPVALTDAQPH